MFENYYCHLFPYHHPKLFFQTSKFKKKFILKYHSRGVWNQDRDQRRKVTGTTEAKLPEPRLD